MSNLNCSFILSPYINVNEFVALGLLGVAILSLLYLRCFSRTPKMDIGLLIFLIGSAGNLYGRLTVGGCVKDYINFFGYFRFNISDVLIILGGVLMVWAIWKKKKK